jgi:hypothetical protein
MNGEFGGLALGVTACGMHCRGVVIGTHFKPPATREAGVGQDTVDESNRYQVGGGISLVLLIVIFCTCCSMDAARGSEER